MERTVRIFIFFCFAFLFADIGAYAGEADAILGKWFTDGKESVVEIYKCDGSICGKIVWLKEPKNEDGTDKVDAENPEESRRKDKIIGLNIVRDFKYEGENKWTEGKIYDPENGKTYSCKMKLDGNKLNVRGYIGISFLGRTTVWTKK